MLMVGAGIAWGIYSLRGRQTGDPTTVTAGNFLKSVPLAAALSLIFLPASWPDVAGCWYAVVSGAVASGVGYALWYTALRGLSATSAATVQLSVPVLAAVGGVIFLGEEVTLRLVVSAVAILGGIALVMGARNP
jgi:drug/metabolite transporter (DMT)-like permease